MPVIPKPEPITEPVQTAFAQDAVLKCVRCFRRAELVFEGTTYCEPCLRESLRTG
jgi:uncharacterized protein CbrC (UPF0167 family)